MFQFQRPHPRRVRAARFCTHATVLFSAALMAACGGGSGSADPADPPPGPPTPPPARALEVAVSVFGDGQVTASPRRSECFDDCAFDFPADGDARLRAVPARGWAFESWSGRCESVEGAVCRLPADGAHGVVATFNRAPVDRGAARWRGGDLHTHSDHSSDGSLGRQIADDAAPGNMPVADIVRLAGNVGLDWLPITDHRTYDHHYDPQWTSDSVLLIPGEEANGRPHATVHGAVDMIDQNADVEGAARSRVVQESIWLAHSQGAAWVTAHPDRDLIDDDGSIDPRADAVGIDLVEVWNRAENPEAEIAYAENRWNAGFRFGVAGASDNHFKELWALGGTPARPRTEVLTDTLSERAVVDALRAGRTHVHARGAGAPRTVLDADFDGDGAFEVQAGEEVFVPAGTSGVLRVRTDNALGSRVLVYASPGRSAGPIARASVVTPGTHELTVDVTTGDTPQWYRAEVRSIGLAEPSSLVFGLVLGPAELENVFQELLDQLRALTSPIFVSEAPVTPEGDALPPADTGRDDGAEYALGRRGAFAGFPDAAFVAGSDALHVVGEHHDATTTRVHYTRRDGGGRWSPPRALADSGSARFPRIAADGDTVVAVWQDERAGQVPRRPAVHLRRSDDGGESFGADIAVRAVDGRAMHPDVALDADGTAHVVWQEIRPGAAFDIWHAQVGIDGTVSQPVNLSAVGKTVSAASPLDARSARYPASVRPAVAVDEAGGVLVAWQDNRSDPDPLWTGQAGSGEGTDPDNWQIAVVRIDGTAGEPVFLGADDAADRHPDIVVDRDGRTHVAWDSKALSAAGVNLAVLAASREAGAGAFAEPVSVSAQPASSARQPRLGLDAGGNARLAWFDSRSADWRWRVMHARHADGAWRDPALIDAPGNNTWPVPAGPHLVFAGTRHAHRLQRDRTQQIFALAETSPARTRARTMAPKLLYPDGPPPGFAHHCDHAAHAPHPYLSTYR